MPPYAIEIALLCVVVTAGWSDWRTRTIPNWITVSGAVLGVVLHTWDSGLAGTLTALGGALLGLGVFMVFFVAGGMGAGDVKLFGAVGALAGPQALMLILVFTGLIGGIAAVAVVIRQRDWQARLPYGVVIAAGTLVQLMV